MAGMGRGDGQLAPIVGACLGWISIAAVMIGCFYVLVMLAAKRLRPSDAVPYGPFIQLGALAAVAFSTVGSHSRRQISFPMATVLPIGQTVETAKRGMISSISWPGGGRNDPRRRPARLAGSRRNNA